MESSGAVAESLESSSATGTQVSIKKEEEIEVETGYFLGTQVVIKKEEEFEEETGNVQDDSPYLGGIKEERPLDIPWDEQILMETDPLEDNAESCLRLVSHGELYGSRSRERGRLSTPECIESNVVSRRGAGAFTALETRAVRLLHLEPGSHASSSKCKRKSGGFHKRREKGSRSLPQLTFDTSAYIMAEFDVELLINAVCNRPALWDKSLEIYKDRNEVAKSWMEVCKVINEDFAALSIPEQKKFEKDVIKKWKTLRGGYRKALERGKKSRRSGAPASKIKKYIFHEQMDFLRKVFESRVTEDTLGSENSSEESAETEAQDPMPCSVPTTSQETQASKKKRPDETRKPDEFEAKLLEAIAVPNRHMAFMQGLLPTLDNFTDDEVLEFQSATLTLIQNIKRARQIRPYSAPPLFAEHHQAPQNIGWGYSSTPQQIQQHHPLITAPQYSQELSQAHYHQATSVTSPVSGATTPSPSSTLFQSRE